MTPETWEALILPTKLSSSVLKSPRRCLVDCESLGFLVFAALFLTTGVPMARPLMGRRAEWRVALVMVGQYREGGSLHTWGRVCTLR